MSGNGISLDDLRLLADIDSCIGDAGGPTMAFTLIQQKQALQDRISFKQWLSDTQAFAHLEEDRHARVTAARQLLRRAELRLNSM